MTNQEIQNRAAAMANAFERLQDRYRATNDHHLADKVGQAYASLDTVSLARLHDIIIFDHYSETSIKDYPDPDYS